MPDEKDFQLKVQRISGLVADLEKIADPESRASAKALMQLLLELHAVGLERTLAIIAGNGESGLRLIEDLGRDPLVSSLLVLYNLHPLEMEARITQAIEKVQPRVRKGGGELEILGIEGGVVRLHLQVTGHACGSTKTTLKQMVEDALYEAAPDMSGLVIEGLEDEAGSAGFVPLGKLNAAVAAAPIVVGQ